MSDYLPNELIIEILARLPVISLIRFTSVCKSWCSLITSPSFVTQHLVQSIKNSKRNRDKLLVRFYVNSDKKERYLLLDDDETFGNGYLELEVPFELPFGYFRVVGSCNGLLCLSDDYFSDKSQIIIWNPSTRKSVTLPMPCKPQCVHMAVFGFGFHPETHEYKVIRMWYEMVHQYQVPPTVEIYAQGTRSWRGISSVPRHCIINYMWCQAFFNGAVHWVAYDPSVMGGFHNLILRFDMASELFSEIMLPPALSDQPPTSLFIKLFGESLAVLCATERGSCPCCIWVMKEYRVAESWTKLFSSNLLGTPNRTLGLRKNGEVLLVTTNALASYATGTKTWTNTGIKGSPRSFYVGSFRETLALVE